MKETSKRCPRGVERKALHVKITFRAYQRLCEIAGPRSLGWALDALLLHGAEKIRAVNTTCLEKNPPGV